MAKMDRAALSGRMVSGGGMNGNMDKVLGSNVAWWRLVAVKELSPDA